MSEIPPNIQPPSKSEIREKAATHYMNLSEDEVEDYHNMIKETLKEYESLDKLAEPEPQSANVYRDTGYRPNSSEDPLNAFITRCDIYGEYSGLLDGQTIALKDNISVAGVEMTCGSKVLEGYVPQKDATVVIRLLNAGAKIIGKANMEDMAVSGGGELSATGPVLNPRDKNHLAGGSSSGSAAAVVSGDADIAIGTDQAGSVRIPSAWCGCVGLKPTHGLVPYTGIVGLGHTYDHVGPIAKSVEDCAITLEIMAGHDPLDPRQTAIEGGKYTEALSDSVEDIEIGILSEAFDRDESDLEVDEITREAIEYISGNGIKCRDVSIPEHREGRPIWIGISNESNTALIRDEGIGHYVRGLYDTQFAEAFGRARRAQANDFPPTMKVRLILGQYLMDEYRGRYHAKAQNLRRSLTKAYDDALKKYDFLVMPTVPMTAHEVKENVSREEIVKRGRSMAGNTAPFNFSGHPAITIPCGSVDGLPVGMMIVGQHFDEMNLLKVASAIESRLDLDFPTKVSE